MHNRGEIRWTPFESVLNTKSMMQELEEKKKKKTKKILSSDELEDLERKIVEAYHTKEKIEVEYYYQGIYYSKKGIINHISQNDKKIYFIDHTSLYFEQVTKIIFI